MNPEFDEDKAEALPAGPIQQPLFEKKRKSLLRLILEPIWRHSGIAIDEQLSFRGELSATVRSGSVLLQRYLPYMVIAFLLYIIIFSPTEEIFIVQNQLTGAVCEERICSSRDKFYCIASTKVLEDYYCDGNSICTADFRLYENDPNCGFVCEKKQCDKMDNFTCDAFTQYLKDYSCNAKQECLPEDIVDENSPACGWLDPHRLRSLGETIEKFGKQVTIYDALAVKEFISFDITYQGMKEVAPVNQKFLFIDVDMVNDTNERVKAHVEDLKLYDSQNNFIIRQAYTAKDSFPILPGGLQPYSKARGKIRYTVPEKELKFTLSGDFKDVNSNIYTRSWAINLEE